MIRATLPQQLRALAHIHGEVALAVPPPVTMRAFLDALEQEYPMLSGTVRDPRTGRRRAYIRFFAAGEDYSDAPEARPLPLAVVEGREVVRVVGAIAGG